MTPGYGFANPFLVPNFAFYVPLEDFAPTTSWIMQHRGELDVLVHPNSGCAVNDHLDWFDTPPPCPRDMSCAIFLDSQPRLIHALRSIWGGTKWELKMSF